MWVGMETSRPGLPTSHVGNGGVPTAVAGKRPRSDTLNDHNDHNKNGPLRWLLQDERNSLDHVGLHEIDMLLADLGAPDERPEDLQRMLCLNEFLDGDQTVAALSCQSASPAPSPLPVRKGSPSVLDTGLPPPSTWQDGLAGCSGDGDAASNQYYSPLKLPRPCTSEPPSFAPPSFSSHLSQRTAMPSFVCVCG